jgi:hypothetical protein
MKLLAKMNFKNHAAIHVVNAPASFMASMKSLAAVKVTSGAALPKTASFIIGFAMKQSDVDAFAKAVAKQCYADEVIWVAYPKGTSKNYTCEFNRDTGWHAFGAAGFEPVRQVAIDDDWSALRMRRVENIKTMTRKSAVSKQGQARIAKTSSKPRVTRVKPR